MNGHAYLSFPPSPEDHAAGRQHGKPNPAQNDLLLSNNKINCLLAGFGTGKSTAAAMVALRAMLENPGSSGMIIAPSYRHTEIILEKMEEILERTRQERGVQLVEKIRRSKGQAFIRLTNGSEAELFSGQNRKSWFGPDKTWILIDEWEWLDDPATVLSSCIHRLRQQTVHGIRVIKYHRVWITSTAKSVSGPLVRMVERAREEHRRAEIEPGFVPEVRVIVAPSTVAIGYGLTLDMIRTWKNNMDARDFRRAVLCDMTPPPEVVYADRFGEHNLVDWTFQPTCKTYFGIDWGVHNTAWLAAQWSPQHEGLVVFREWYPGSDEPGSVGDGVREMRRAAREWGLVDERGMPLARGTFEAFGDPTPNPRQFTNVVREEELLAAEGDRLLRGMGWTYSFPKHPRHRSKSNQVTLMRMLLRPKVGAPRIYFARSLAANHDRMTVASHTRHGIVAGLQTGLRYKRDSRGQVIEEIDKTTGYDHLHDGLLYMAVRVFGAEFDRLLHEEYGLLSGAAAWTGDGIGHLQEEGRRP